MSGRRLLPPILLLVLLPGCAPLPPQEALGLSAGALSDQWSIRWDPVFRTPAQMMNRSLQEEDPGGAPAVSDSVAEAAVRAVFREHPDWFRMRPGIDDVRIVRSYARGFMRLLRVGQTYRGIPVAGAGYEARVLGSGRLGSLEGRFHPEILIDADPVIHAQQAEAMATAAFPPNASAASGTPFPHFQFEYDEGFRDPRVLVVVPQADRYVLAWGVLLERPPAGTWRVYVDAVNGSVIGDQYLGERLWR